MGILDGVGPGISHPVMSPECQGYIHQNDSHASRQMLYRLIKNARGSIHIKLALGGQDITLAPASENLYLVFIHTETMVYFSDDSEQYTSWKKVGNLATYSAVSRRLSGRASASKYSVEGRVYDRGIGSCRSV